MERLAFQELVLIRKGGFFYLQSLENEIVAARGDLTHTPLALCMLEHYNCWCFASTLFPRAKYDSKQQGYGENGRMQYRIEKNGHVLFS